MFTPRTPANAHLEYPHRSEDAILHTVPPNLAGFLTAMRAEDDRSPFDLFHGFTLPAAHSCLLVAARGRRPVIASIRGVDGVAFDQKAIQVLQQANWITSVSRESLKRAEAYTDIGERSSFIPNGVDLADRPEWRPDASNPGVVGTVATFRPKKNIPLLLRAYAQVAPSLRKQLLLVGDFYFGNSLVPELRRQAVELVNELGITREVLFAGYVENERLAEYRRQMRVFVLSSDHEGLPNAVLEAAAEGLPIVATAVDGIKDIFRDGQDALLVEPGDCEQLSAAIERVLTERELSLHLSQGARDAVSQLTPEAEARAYAELYRSLLDHSLAT